jgi:hypothetical protein
MKLQELAQNLSLRIGVIQVIAFVLLTLLGVRLYYLQVVRGEHYAERAENQRIRLIPIPAPRGAIFDRNGKILVDSRPTFNVVISNEPLKEINVEERIDTYAGGLNLEPQVRSRADQFDQETKRFRDAGLKEMPRWRTSPGSSRIRLSILSFASNFSRSGSIRTAPGSPTCSVMSARSAPNSLNLERWQRLKAWGDHRQGRARGIL